MPRRITFMEEKSTAPKPFLQKKDWLSILALCFFALLCRIHFLFLIRHDPIFVMPIIDSLEFDRWGYMISQGQLLWPQITNHTPVYAYFVGLIYLLAGYTPLTVILIQYALSAISLIFLYRLAWECFNTSAAVMACLFAATYWFFIYTNSFIFSENLSIFLNILMVYQLICLKDTWQKYLGAGLSFALSTLCRPEVTPFALGVIIYIFLMKISWQRKAFFSILFLIFYILLTSAAITHNHRISGDKILRTQVGANVYMGNNPDLKGTNLYLKIGRDWDRFISSPHYHHKRNVSETEANTYFMEKTWEIIKNRPMEWAGLIAAKAYSVITGREFLRTEDVYVYNFYFTNTPYSLISTKLIFIFALIGLFLSIRERRQVFLLYFILITFIAMFFLPLKTRYLMGVMPFMILFAGFGMAKLFEMFKQKAYKPLRKILAGILFLTLASMYNPLRLTLPDVSEAFYAIGINFYGRGNVAKAEEYFLAATRLDPRYVSVHQTLGVLYLENQRCSEADKHLREAYRLDPQLPPLNLNNNPCAK